MFKVKTYGVDGSLVACSAETKHLKQAMTAADAVMNSHAGVVVSAWEHNERVFLRTLEPRGEFKQEIVRC